MSRLAILVEPVADEAARLAEWEELCRDGALRVKDAAPFLGISDSLLYEYLAAGTLPHGKLGRATVIPKRALVRHLAKNMSPNMTAADPGPEVK